MSFDIVLFRLSFNAWLGQWITILCLEIWFMRYVKNIGRIKLCVKNRNIKMYIRNTIKKSSLDSRPSTAVSNNKYLIKNILGLKMKKIKKLAAPSGFTRFFLYHSCIGGTKQKNLYTVKPFLSETNEQQF